MNRKIMLEWGHESLHQFMKLNSGLDKISKIQTFAQEDYGVELTIMPYLTIHSDFLGGRPGVHDFCVVKNMIEDMNKAGISVSNVLNGGLTFGDEDCSKAISKVLADIKSLSRFNKKFKVNNCVTVLRDDLNAAIKSQYPNIKTISSCIKQLEPKGHQTFRDLLKRYDYVVPLNQQISIKFLSHYADCADRFILFLFVTCAKDDLFQCYMHYCRMEIKRSSCAFAGNCLVEKTYWEKHVSPECLNISPPRIGLNGRFVEVAELAGMGFNKFKIPKTYDVNRQDLELLFQAVQSG